jgi:hypothetical protein
MTSAQEESLSERENEVIHRLETEGMVYDESYENDAAHLDDAEMEMQHDVHLEGQEYVDDFRIANAYDQTIASHDQKPFTPREPARKQRPRNEKNQDYSQFYPPAQDVQDLPPPSNIWEGKEELNQLVTSWYNAGYYTGYYLGKQAALKEQQ